MIVLDASAWVDMLVGLARPFDAREQVVVPPHFEVETLGTLRALTQRGALTELQASARLEQHLRTAFEVVRDEGDIRQAWQWRESMSFRDAWYAAIARRHDVTWLTSDTKARKTAARLGVSVAAPSPRDRPD